MLISWLAKENITTTVPLAQYHYGRNEMAKAPENSLQEVAVCLNMVAENNKQVVNSHTAHIERYDEGQVS